MTATSSWTWGWSDTSLEEATANAMARAQRIRDWFASGDRTPGPNAYGYPDRPVREQVLREFPGATGQPAAAVITRNTMGCLVLNTTNLMFVDIDEPEPATRRNNNKGGGLLSMLFGRKKEKPAEQETEDPLETKIKTTVETWLQSHPGWAWRIYRTKAGLRFIPPTSPSPRSRTW